jgi:hypothetical protein
MLLTAVLCGCAVLGHIAPAYAQDDGSLTDAQATAAAQQLMNDLTMPADITPAGNMPQSALPHCTDPATQDYIKATLLNATPPLQTLQIGNIHTDTTNTGRELCTVVLITSRGIGRFLFQYMGNNDARFLIANVAADQTDLDLNN